MPILCLGFPSQFPIEALRVFLLRHRPHPLSGSRHPGTTTTPCSQNDRILFSHRRRFLFCHRGQSVEVGLSIGAAGGHLSLDDFSLSSVGQGSGGKVRQCAQRLLADVVEVYKRDHFYTENGHRLAGLLV